MGDVELTELICEHLGALDGWQWGGDGAYPGDVVGVFYGAVDATPDRAVGVSVYDRADRPREYVRGRRVQLLLRGERGNPGGADALADVAVQRMEALALVPGIAYVEALSFARLGADENGRQERTENLHITFDNEEATAP